MFHTAKCIFLNNRSLHAIKFLKTNIKKNFNILATVLSNTLLKIEMISFSIAKKNKGKNLQFY